jgi:hypothetical protein
MSAILVVEGEALCRVSWMALAWTVGYATSARSFFHSHVGPPQTGRFGERKDAAEAIMLGLGNVAGMRFHTKNPSVSSCSSSASARIAALSVASDCRVRRVQFDHALSGTRCAHPMASRHIARGSCD